MKKLKFILLILIFNLSIIIVQAHESDKSDIKIEETFGPAVSGGINNLESISPIAQIEHGKLAYGIFLIFLWIATVGGIITLFLMILQRIIIIKPL